MTTSVPILGYWNIRGIAQPIRYLLEYAGVKYEDKLYDYGEYPKIDKTSWLSVKPNMELDFPNLPYYMDNNVKLSQSDVIMRYLARKYKLNGKNEMDDVRIELLSAQVRDYQWDYYGIAYNEKFYELKDEYINEKLIDRMNSLSKFMGNRKYVVGDYVTYADFQLFEFLEGQCLLVENLLDDYPVLKEYHNRIRSLEAIDNYFKSPKAIKSPFNGGTCRIGGKYSHLFRKEN